MGQKLVIDVETNKPLSSLGDNHIIFYNSSTNKYYVTTYESFLEPQKNAIEKIEKENKDLKNNFDNLIKIENKKRQELEEKFQAFVEEMNNKYNEFLNVYKETNAKLINMVKTVVIEEE